MNVVLKSTKYLSDRSKSIVRTIHLFYTHELFQNNNNYVRFVKATVFYHAIVQYMHFDVVKLLNDKMYIICKLMNRTLTLPLQISQSS